QHRIDPGRQGPAGTDALRADEAGHRGADAEYVGGDDAPRSTRELRAPGADRYAHDGVGDEIAGHPPERARADFDGPRRPAARDRDRGRVSGFGRGELSHGPV